MLWLLLVVLAQTAPSDTNWPSFRGARAAGVAEGYDPPVAWDVESGKNVLWRVDMPGLAHSSPVVWGERVFVTTAVKKAGEAELSSLFGSPGYGAGQSVEAEGEHSFELHCLDKHTGKLLWSRVAYAGVPEVKRHPKSTHANSTPACDATRVLAFFGSEGLYCYDHEGKLLWSKDFGVLDSGAPDVDDTAAFQWGFASSPVIHGQAVIVQCDVQKDSFVAALSLADGKELWRTPRDERPTWGTPTVADLEKGAAVVLNGYHHAAAYDVATGAELWSLHGGGDVPVPTPVVGHGNVYLTSAHGSGRPIRAIRLTARGDLGTASEGEHVAWNLPGAGVYMQTPLVYGEELYACSDAGILACYDAHTGSTNYRERLGDGSTGFSGSPIAAEGKLYLSGENGQVFVVAAGPSFEVLGVNELGENHLATPALSAGVLFFHTHHHVLAVGEKK